MAPVRPAGALAAEGGYGRHGWLGGWLGGFGVEAVKSLVTGDAGGGVWWALAVMGLALVALGWWSRLRVERPARVGVVVLARDPRRDLAKADQQDDAAQRFVTGGDRLGWRVATELTGRVSDAGLIDQVAGQVHVGVVAARTLARVEARVDLVPVLPLHAAFRLGARLGHSHATEIVVHAARRVSEHGYFAAVPLAVSASSFSPLVAEPMEALPGGDPSHVALAVNLQGLASFLAMVREECRWAGAGRLLYLHSTDYLTPDERTFTGVVDQLCEVWRDAPLPDAARTGPHAIFLSGPVAISLALGARLAAVDSASWTAYTHDDATGRYEPMAAGPVTTG